MRGHVHASSSVTPNEKPYGYGSRNLTKPVALLPAPLTVAKPQHRRTSVLAAVVAGGRERGQRGAVVRAVLGQDLRASAARGGRPARLGALGHQPRHADRRLVGLCAARREQKRVEVAWRDGGEQLRRQVSRWRRCGQPTLPSLARISVMK